jgi:hypothetical protein
LRKGWLRVEIEISFPEKMKPTPLSTPLGKDKPVRFGLQITEKY